MQRKAFLFMMMAIVFANATFGPAISSLTTDGFSALSDGAGVGYVVWLVGLWCLYTLSVSRQREVVDRWDYVIGAVISVPVLIPSAMMAWFALAAAATYGALRASSGGIVRTPYVVMIAVALRVPMTTLLLGTMSEEVLSLDAIFVRGALAFTDIQTELIGNILVNTDGHRLGVMTGCSSFTNVSMGLLVWFAITRGNEHHVSARAMKAGAVVAFSIIALNVLRLSLMAITPDLYHLIHDGIGKDIFEVSLVAATLGLTFLGLGGTHENADTSLSRPHARLQ